MLKLYAHKHKQKQCKQQPLAQQQHSIYGPPTRMVHRPIRQRQQQLMKKHARHWLNLLVWVLFLRGFTKFRENKNEILFFLKKLSKSILNLLSDDCRYQCPPLLSSFFISTSNLMNSSIFLQFGYRSLNTKKSEMVLEMTKNICNISMDIMM